MNYTLTDLIMVLVLVSTIIWGGLVLKQINEVDYYGIISNSSSQQGVSK